MNRLLVLILLICLASSIGCATVHDRANVASTRKERFANHQTIPAPVVEELPTVRTAGFISSQQDTGTVTQSKPFRLEAVEDVSLASLALSLEDVQAMALANNPTILVAQATIDKAVGLRSQVGISPNPTLGYFGQQINDRGTSQHGIFVEQEFVRGEKLGINRQVLGHTRNVQSAVSDAQRYRVLTDVRIRYFEAVAAQQQVEAIQEFGQVAARGVQAAEKRQKADEGSLIETLQSQTLASEVSLAAEQAMVAYQGAWQDLAAIAGINSTTPARLTTELEIPDSVPNWDESYNKILEQSPELAAAQANVCEKLALLRREQVQPIPNVTGQFGVGYDDGTDHSLMNVQLSAPIPVRNKNTGNISAAYSDYVRATHEIECIRQAIRSRLARTAQGYESAMKSVRKYEDEIIPQVNKSLELSEKAYQAGELDFLQVLVVRRSCYEASVKLIQAKGQLAQSKATVDGLLLTGGLEIPIDYTRGDGIRGASFGGQ